jgi:hypothetical protein
MEHLIHIGLPKTGSTLLQRWLAAHPQIAFRDGGIAGFSDVHDVARQSASPSSGRRLRVTSSEFLSLGYSRAGLDVDYDDKGTALPESRARTCASLADLFPTAHILLVTRGFRGAILSTYSEYVRVGGEKGLVAFADEWARDFCDLQGIIRLYRERFAERLIVLPYELLRDDRNAFVREVEGRFGLDHRPVPDERINPSLSGEELYWCPRLARLIRRLPIGNRLRRAVFRHYTRRIGGRALRLVVRLAARFRPPPPEDLDAVSDALVRSRFGGEAALLRDYPLYAPYAREYGLDRAWEAPRKP